MASGSDGSLSALLYVGRDEVVWRTYLWIAVSAQAACAMWVSVFVCELAGSRACRSMLPEGRCYTPDPAPSMTLHPDLCCDCLNYPSAWQERLDEFKCKPLFLLQTCVSPGLGFCFYLESAFLFLFFFLTFESRIRQEILLSSALSIWSWTNRIM